MRAHPRLRLAAGCGRRRFVNSLDSAQEFSLTAVAGVSDRARGYSEAGERDMSVTPNRDHRFRAQGIQQPGEQRSTSFALFSRMTPIRHRIVRRMGVQREDIPQKDGALQLFNHGPDHGCSTLAYGRALRCLRQLWRPEKRGVRSKVNLVGESEAGATPASVTKVSGNPNGIYTTFHCSSENDRQIAAANGGGVSPVVAVARVHVRIENRLELQFGNASNKVIYVGMIFFHSSQLIRSQEEVEELSTDFLKETCRWGSNERRKPLAALTGERTRFEDWDGRGQNTRVILPASLGTSSFGNRDQ
jgi:hypothetical protein